MNLSDDLRTFVIELIANNRTIATGAAATTSVSFGAIGLLEIMNKGLAFVAMAAGIYCTMALSRYHRRNARNLALKNLELEKMLVDAGVDITKAEQ